MTEYQPFAISNFRTGFNQSLEPWLLPRDGFPYMKNAHLYRGVVEKILGYSLLTNFSYRKTIQLSGTINNINTVYTGTLSPRPSTNNFYAQASINVGATDIESFTYSSDGTSPVVNLTSNLGGTGTVNLTTGAVTLTFNTPPAIVPGGFNRVIFTYDFFNTATVGTEDIMGIKQYYNQTGGREIIVFNTRRAGKVVNITGAVTKTLMQMEYGISEIPHEVKVQAAAPIPAFDSATLTFTGTLAAPLVPGSVVIKLYAVTTNILKETITDNGFGLLTGYNTATPPVATGTTGFINYSTGAWTITFNTAPTTGDTLNTFNCVYGDTFTGDYTNFFSVCNFQNKMFITNNVDNIRYYDGMCLKYLNTNLSTTNPANLSYDITKCLHVAINRDRLLLLAPVVLGIPVLNTIYWSTINNPLLFTNNEALPAPTSEAIRLFSFINTDMVVRFANSERIFRYTGDPFFTFRWDSTNVLWRCDTNYSDINYDSWFSSVGRAAIVGSDGVNIQRADPNIPDFTLNDRGQFEGPVISINQTSIGQCYGERFDDFKEGWLCFKRSTAQDSATVERSDSVLAYNYTDNTYAVYDFPLTCLGFGQITVINTWSDNFDKWRNAEYSWNSFFEQTGSLIDLGGDRGGYVYNLGDANTYTSGNFDLPVLFDVLSKNFNPFIEDGELCRFGYVDFLFSANQTTKVRVQIYANDNLYVDSFGQPAGWYKEVTLTLTPTDDMSSNAQAKVWKRVYVGAVAKEHTVRIYQNTDDFTADTQDQPVRLHAMVLYMKPAGRIFN